MRQLLLLVLGLGCFSAYSQDEMPRHQISFGNTTNTAFSSSATSAKTDSDLGIDTFMNTVADLGVSYAYRVSDHFQITGILTRKVTENEVEADNGNEATTTETNTSLYVGVLYNFSKELKNSWFIGASLGRENYDTEVDYNFQDDEDEDYSVDVASLHFGKRINLEGLGIKNLTYAPMISLVKGTVNGDLEDQGVEELSTAVLDIIKFDLLF